MDIFIIEEEFRKMAGISAISAAEWLPLCASAASALNARLKPGVFCDETAPLIYNAAAAMAFHHYTLTRVAQSDGGSFRAGDVSVTEDRSKSAAASEKLMQSALNAVYPYLADENFCFKQVCDD